MAITFNTNLHQAEGKNATGIIVPTEIIESLGKAKRPAVKVTLNGYTYRTTVGGYGEIRMVPVSAEHREAAGLKAGDALEVTLELDTEPRIVTVPDDLAAALAEQPGAIQIFDGLAHSKRKEFVRQVEDAKTDETRQRRIAGIVTKMTEA